ncbi:MAG: MAPEG family protein [Agarilytica sp.]
MIYPMFAMVMITIGIGLIAFVVRIKSVKSGEVRVRAYKLMGSEEYPEGVVKTTRCLNNQFEIPVLFYVGCLAYLSLEVLSGLGLVFAWAFVGLRVVHAYILMTYNHLLHRLVVFWMSVLMVLCLWVQLILKVA